jgi:hypothetical protein
MATSCCLRDVSKPDRARVGGADQGDIVLPYKRLETTRGQGSDHGDIVLPERRL